MEGSRGEFASLLEWHQAQGRFQHVVKFAMDENFGAVRDRGQFCADNFGPDAIVFCDIKDAWIYNANGIWTFMGYNYYFDNEEDAVAFSLFTRG